MNKPNLQAVPESNDVDERTAEEIAADLRSNLKRDQIEQLFTAIDSIDAKIAQLKEKKRTAFTKLTELGAHKKGLQLGYKRTRATTGEQAAIDATFKVVCELLSGQEDLFGYRPKS